jgi:hypothetical protein
MSGEETSSTHYNIYDKKIQQLLKYNTYFLVLNISGGHIFHISDFLGITIISKDVSYIDHYLLPVFWQLPGGKKSMCCIQEHMLSVIKCMDEKVVPVHAMKAQEKVEV